MGLKVVDVHGNRIGYWSSIWRLAVQAIIVGIIYPAVSMWITLSLLATDWGQQEIIGFGPRHIIKTVAPTFAVAICYLVSLFTAKGQTLFDIATHRVVTDDRRAGSLRISRDKLFVRLREALNILTRSRNGKSDKLLMFCFGWVCVSCLLCVGIALLVVYSLGEANRAISESTTTNELGSNPHYANARRWFRNLRNLPYYVTPFPTEEDASKATMLSPRNWSVRTAYGLRLEREGDYGGAFNELSEALSYRIRANNDDIIGTQRYTAREKYPLPYSVSHEPSISELYFKLRILSNRLERYEVAESYLKEARRYRTPK